jgi:hypothetical protein
MRMACPKSWDWEEPMEEAMLKLIEDLSPDVIGIEANGKVTHEDYQNILIPKAETMMAKGPIKMLYVTSPATSLRRCRMTARLV